jgi:hypothetical protein
VQAGLRRAVRRQGRGGRGKGRAVQGDDGAVQQRGLADHLTVRIEPFSACVHRGRRIRGSLRSDAVPRPRRTRTAARPGPGPGARARPGAARRGGGRGDEPSGHRRQGRAGRGRDQHVARRAPARRACRATRTLAASARREGDSQPDLHRPSRSRPPVCRLRLLRGGHPRRATRPAHMSHTAQHPRPGGPRDREPPARNAVRGPTHATPRIHALAHGAFDAGSIFAPVTDIASRSRRSMILILRSGAQEGVPGHSAVYDPRLARGAGPVRRSGSLPRSPRGPWTATVPGAPCVFAGSRPSVRMRRRPFARRHYCGWDCSTTPGSA